MGLEAAGPGRFRLGEVTLDKRERSVSFPAAINQREGTIEYVVVAETGKTHESLLKTTAKPMHIHLALLLLGVRAPGTNEFQPNQPPPGQPVRVELRWTQAGQARRAAAEEWVLDRQTREAMKPGVWIYNGSNISEGMFTAQRDGSVISTRIDPDALINNPRPGRENDDRYEANTSRLAPAGSVLEVVIRIDAGQKP